MGPPAESKVSGKDTQGRRGDVLLKLLHQVIIWADFYMYTIDDMWVITFVCGRRKMVGEKGGREKR